MTLNVAQYLAPLNGGQVLNGYVQGVRQGTGIAIAADGTITLDTTGASTLGFLTSSTTPAPVYNWTLSGSNPGGILTNDGVGNVTWETDYVPTLPVGQAFPHTGAAVLPAGPTAGRPGNQAGLLRYSTTFGYLEFNNGSAWLPVTPSTGAVFTFVGAVTPTANAVGDLWLDTNTGQAKMWTGTQWQATTPLATTAVPGRVIVGTNINVAADGTISVDSVTGVAGGISNLGLVTVTDNVSSLSVDSALSANQGRLLQEQINALLIANNLTFAGLVDGSGILTFVTPEGTLAGFTVGQPLPNAVVANDGYFVMVTASGGFTPPGGAYTVVTQGDWFLSTGAVWQFLDVGYDPPYATTTNPGIVRLSTVNETQDGTDNTVAVTPFSLNARTALETRTGIAAIATQVQTDAGTDDATIVTPLKLATLFSSGAIDANTILTNPIINGKANVQQALEDAIYDITSTDNTLTITISPTGLVNLSVIQATETQKGGAEIATQAETDAGTDDNRIVTPLKLGQFISSGGISAGSVSVSPTINGYANVQDALGGAIYNIVSPNTTISVSEAAVGNVSIEVNQATETQLGGAEIATQAEADAGTDDTRILTPKKLFGVLSSGAIDANDILLSPVINGNTNVQTALQDAIYDVTSANTSITVAIAATGLVTLTAVDATTTQKGVVELATNAEVVTGTDTVRAVTPAGVRNAAVYKSDFNAKGNLLTATGNDAPSILSVGADGQILIADSTTATGLKYTSNYVSTTGATGVANIPAGTTAQQPATPATGAIRYNSDTTSLEFYNGTDWETVASSSGTSFVEKTSSTGAALIPAGTTAQRPAPGAGYFRLNTATQHLEFYNGSSWQEVVSGTSPTPAIPGSVTSVDVSGGTTGFTFAGGPITTSGTITMSGTLGIANGGTGGATAQAARNNLLPTQTGNAGEFLTTNGTNVSWAPLTQPATLAQAQAGALTTVYSSPQTSVPKDASGMTGSAYLPAGTTAQRPSAATYTGQLRYNTALSQLEYSDGVAWIGIGGVIPAATLAEAQAGTINTSYSSPRTSVPKNASGMTGSAFIPAGGTGARPAAALYTGQFRYNTALTQLEYSDGTNWIGVLDGNLTAATLAEAQAGTLTTVYSTPRDSVPKSTSGMTGSAYMPAGTTAQRPGFAAYTGQLRYNTSLPRWEYSDGTAWLPLVAGSAKIAQVVSMNNTNGIAFSGFAWPSPVQISITPTNALSTIIVTWDVNTFMADNTGNATTIYASLAKNGTNLYPPADYPVVVSGSVGGIAGLQSSFSMSSSSTFNEVAGSTAARTYRVLLWGTSGTSFEYKAGSITAFEVLP